MEFPAGGAGSVPRKKASHSAWGRGRGAGVTHGITCTGSGRMSGRALGERKGKAIPGEATSKGRGATRRDEAYETKMVTAQRKGRAESMGGQAGLRVCHPKALQRPGQEPRGRV